MFTVQGYRVALCAICTGLADPRTLLSHVHVGAYTANFTPSL